MAGKDTAFYRQQNYITEITLQHSSRTCEAAAQEFANRSAESGMPGQQRTFSCSRGWPVGLSRKVLIGKFRAQDGTGIPSVPEWSS
jgi:hypothetical protein